MTNTDLGVLRFFVGVHNDTPLPPARDDYTAIGLGGYHPTQSMHSVSDASGLNISNKNIHYSELTGWHWLWKNLRDTKYIGLAHYRRYFLLDPSSPLYFRYNQVLFQNSTDNLSYLTHPDRSAFALDIVSSGKIIIPQRLYLGESIYSHYLRCHLEEDWGLFINAIIKLWPEYYSHLEWFYITGYLHPFNLMIAPKHFFDSYMADLFCIFDHMESVKPFRMEPYQCRVPAFLAERFFTFYVYIMGTRIFEVPVAFIQPAD